MPRRHSSKTTRKQLWGHLIWRIPVIAVGILTIFLSTASYWWDEIFPSLRRPHLADVSWYWWVICGLLAAMVLFVERALQIINAAEDAFNLERGKHQTPDIHGDILGVFWDFVTINKKTGLNLLDIFVRLRLVNHEDIGTTTKESRLRIEFNGGQYEAKGESPGLGKIVHASSYRDEFTTGKAGWGEEFGVVTSVAPFYPHIPLQISVEQKGWIKFRINGEFKDQPPDCNIDVTIVDSLGGDHSVHGKHLPFNLGRFNV